MTDTVSVTFAADTRNVALARTVGAAMAARADLPLDQLEDVRLAVDEAVTEAIASARPGSDVTCTFAQEDDRLAVAVAVPAGSDAPPSTTSFGWTVLSALVDSATADVSDGILTIRLQVTSDLASA